MNAVQPIINAGQLTRVFRAGASSVIGIDRIDLTVAPGELVVVKGNSGSGKSTLLSLIAGLDQPTGGRLTVAGHDLQHATPTALTRYRREVVGMVFQSFNLMPTLSVLENVSLPALLAGKPYGETRRKAGDMIERLDLRHRAAHLPSELSGGEMQRTAIARALINDPAIVLADEPTGNLDTRNGEIVIDWLTDLNRRWGTTVLIATHSQLADAAADRILKLRDGTIAERVCTR